MSKKDIIKKYKGTWVAGKWLKRYLFTRTIKRKYKNKFDE